MNLIGLALNGGIVIWSALKAYPRARDVISTLICEAFVKATRRIVVTTLTTIGVFLLLILWSSLFNRTGRWPITLVNLPVLLVRNTRCQIVCPNQRPCGYLTGN